MKIYKLVLLLLLIFHCFECYSQIGDTTSIHIVALKEHLKYLKEAHQKAKKTMTYIYIQDKENINLELPKKVEGVDIIFLNYAGIRDKTRKGEKIRVVVIQPIKINQKFIEITFIDFMVSSKSKQNFHYINNDGNTFVFGYNCDKGEFEIVDKK